MLINAVVVTIHEHDLIIVVLQTVLFSNQFFFYITHNLKSYNICPWPLQYTQRKLKTHKI